MRHSQGEKDLVEVPFEELRIGSVDSAFGYSDELACSLVELLTVVKFCSEPRAHEEPVFGVHAEVAAIEEGVYVRAQQEAVAESVLAA